MLKSGNLIDRLKVLQGEKKQKEFAEWLGESPSTVNGYMTGFRRPGIDLLISLAERGVNVNWLLTGRGAVYIENSGRALDELPANLKRLVEDLLVTPAMIDDVAAVVRSKQELEEAMYMLKQSFSRKKKKA